MVSRTGNWPARPPAPARAGGNLHYLGGYERKLAGGSNSPETITKYYSASLGAHSRPVAFRRGGTLHWVGSDHLGGTIRVLDGSFTALDGMRYEPYGEDRDSGDSLNTDRKFTGQTEDEAVGMYWYASRAYDPDAGRFCTPDPIVPAPGYPPALNRYSYVYNNPLKYVDPSGHSPEWFNEAWREEFYDVHGKKPEDGDYIYRFVTMADATGLKEQIFGPLSHDYGLPFAWPAGDRFDLGANIRRAAELGTDRSPLSALEFASLLVPGGEWDYKTTIGPKFQNFGNFHFGIVVSAFLEAHTPVPSPRRPITPALVPQEARDKFALGVAGGVHILWTGGGNGP